MVVRLKDGVRKLKMLKRILHFWEKLGNVPHWEVFVILIVFDTQTVAHFNTALRTILYQMLLIIFCLISIVQNSLEYSCSLIVFYVWLDRLSSWTYLWDSHINFILALSLLWLHLLPCPFKLRSSAPSTDRRPWCSSSGRRWSVQGPHRTRPYPAPVCRRL